MSTILDLPEMRDRVKRWSVQEYERRVEEGVFGKNVELIHGFVMHKMSKSPLHGSTSKKLYDSILGQAGPGYSVRQDLPLKLRDSLPEPDVAVVIGNDSDFLTHHPTTAALVIEVAVSSAALDREGALMYAEAGVVEYWIVLPKLNMVEVYSDLNAGGFRSMRVVESPHILQCGSVPSISIKLEELFPAA